MEVDLRSEEKDKRCLNFRIKGRWEKTCFIGLPSSVLFGVCLFKFILNVYYLYLYKLMNYP